MIQDSADFSQHVEAAVEAIERVSDAQIVVVAAPRSGRYVDIIALCSWLVALLTLFLSHALPHSFSVLAVAIDMSLAGALTAYTLMNTGLLALLLRLCPDRTRAQVEREAAAEFFIELVHATPRRTGVLIFISGLERRVIVRADLGVEAACPASDWLNVERAFNTHSLSGLLQGLSALEETLSKHLPVSEEQTVNLPNSPRIR